jgi:hypothetical protein
VSLSTDWVLLGLRFLFVAILYLFLYKIYRITAKELTAFANDDPVLVPYRASQIQLVVLEPAESSLDVGTTFALTRDSVVGRRLGCTITIDDSFVSAEHAHLLTDGKAWYVEDLGSTNGTFVNGREVIEMTGIDNGDVVQFGRVELRLVC